MPTLIFKLGLVLLRAADSEERCDAIDATGTTNFDEDNELLQVNADRSSHDSVLDGVCSIDVGKCAKVTTSSSYGPKRAFKGDTLKVGSKSSFGNGCILVNLDGSEPKKQGKSLSGMGFDDTEVQPVACPFPKGRRNAIDAGSWYKKGAASPDRPSQPYGTDTDTSWYKKGAASPDRPSQPYGDTSWYKKGAASPDRPSQPYQQATIAAEAKAAQNVAATVDADTIEEVKRHLKQMSLMPSSKYKVEINRIFKKWHPDKARDNPLAGAIFRMAREHQSWYNKRHEGKPVSRTDSWLDTFSLLEDPETEQQSERGQA